MCWHSLCKECLCTWKPGCPSGLCHTCIGKGPSGSRMECGLERSQREATRNFARPTLDFLSFGEPHISQPLSQFTYLFSLFPSWVVGDHPSSISYSQFPPTLPSSLVHFSSPEFIIEHTGIPETTPRPLLKCQMIHCYDVCGVKIIKRQFLG